MHKIFKAFIFVNIMFQKRCPGCKQGISKKFSYCPFCGFDFRESSREEAEENDALLDQVESMFKFPNFNSLLREIDKQVREFDKSLGKENQRIYKKPSSILPAKGISISISTSSGREPVIRVQSFGMPQPAEKIMKQEKPFIKPADTSGREDKLAKLPKKEPKTSVRRLTDRVVYEINLPGIKSMDDIAIKKLENSIEIKAFTRDAAYFKLIPIALQILRYYIEGSTLYLELKPEG